eukprot:553573-Prymnesium_polylepis.1
MRRPATPRAPSACTRTKRPPSRPSAAAASGSWASLWARRDHSQAAAERRQRGRAQSQFGGGGARPREPARDAARWRMHGERSPGACAH